MLHITGLTINRIPQSVTPQCVFESCMAEGQQLNKDTGTAGQNKGLVALYLGQL